MADEYVRWRTTIRMASRPNRGRVSGSITALMSGPLMMASSEARAEIRQRQITSVQMAAITSVVTGARARPAPSAVATPLPP